MWNSAFSFLPQVAFRTKMAARYYKVILCHLSTH